MTTVYGIRTQFACSFIRVSACCRETSRALHKTPPAAVLLRKAAAIEKGSGEPNKSKVGKVTRAQVEEIARTKMPDLTAADMEAAVRMIAGSARSMGVDVEGL